MGSAGRGFFLTPYTESPESYASAKAGWASYDSGSHVAPAVIKTPMSQVAPYLESTTGANGELEYFIQMDHLDNVPLPRFKPIDCFND